MVNHNKTKSHGEYSFAFIPWVSGIVLMAICIVWIVVGIWAAWVAHVTLY